MYHPILQKSVQELLILLFDRDEYPLPVLLSCAQESGKLRHLPYGLIHLLRLIRIHKDVSGKKTS